MSNFSLSQITNHKSIRSTRDGFGEALLGLGEKNPDVVVLSADLSESTRAKKFAEKFPERFVECGVAEQNMMGIAAGLALSGKIPFATSFGVFSPGRNWEQLRASVCYSQANVKTASTHAGLLTGADGATHQALEDIALTRVLPNLVVLSPADFYQAKNAVFAAAEYKGPVYIRLTRGKTAVFTKENEKFKIGKADVLRKGRDLTLIATGPVVYEALMAAEKLKDKARIEVINLSTIKPLDKMTILASAEKTGKVVTIEDHQVFGGMGSAVSEFLSEELPVPVIRFGVPDVFGESGKGRELWEKYGLNTEGIVRRIMEIL